jgi:hypothetical protein
VDERGSEEDINNLTKSAGIPIPALKDFFNFIVLPKKARFRKRRALMFRKN